VETWRRSIAVMCPVSLDAASWPPAQMGSASDINTAAAFHGHG